MNASIFREVYLSTDTYICMCTSRAIFGRPKYSSLFVPCIVRAVWVATAYRNFVIGFN